MAAKPNRTDLNNKATKVAKQTVPGQTYGKATEQMQSQSLVPMAPPPTEMKAAPVGPAPGRLGAFARPTERPNEPLTAGVDFGAGAGSMQAGMPMRSGTEEAGLAELRAIYQMYPDDALGSMLDSYLREGR